MTPLLELCLPLAFVLGVALVELAIWPELGLEAARAFYIGSDHFVGYTRAGVIIRYTAWALPFVVCGPAASWLRGWPRRGSSRGDGGPPAGPCCSSR